MAYMAIETKFLGPTNFRGSRIKAQAMDSWSNGKRESVTVGYNYALNSEDNHLEAAKKLLPKISRPAFSDYHLEAGATERGYVFVIVRNSEVNIGYFRQYDVPEFVWDEIDNARKIDGRTQ